MLIAQPVFSQMELTEIINAYINKDHASIVKNCSDIWEVDYDKVFYKDNKIFSDRITLSFNFKNYEYHTLELFRDQNEFIHIYSNKIFNSIKAESDKDNFREIYFGGNYLNLLLNVNHVMAIENNICLERLNGNIKKIGFNESSILNDPYCKLDESGIKFLHIKGELIKNDGAEVIDCLVPINFFYEKPFVPSFNKTVFVLVDETNNNKVKINNHNEDKKLELKKIHTKPGDSLFFSFKDLDTVKFYDPYSYYTNYEKISIKELQEFDFFRKEVPSQTLFDSDINFLPIKYGEQSMLFYSNSEFDEENSGENPQTTIEGKFTEYELSKFFHLKIANQWKFIPLEGNYVHGEVIVEINGTKYKYLIDSGASFLTISESMASEYLLTDAAIDLNSNIELEIANGSVMRAKKIIIKKIKIGGSELENILAVVLPDDVRLLGMSVLNKFKTWELDLKNQYLIIRK